MLVPAFTVNLNQKLLAGRVTIGRYDGIHPCLTASTTRDKVLIHNPHQQLGTGGGRMSLNTSSSDVALLNINQSVTALVAGNLSTPGKNTDTLVVCTPTNVLAYDVQNNADVFYKEVSDGSNAVTIGRLWRHPTPLALVGGNCSVQGFDATGADMFWTTAGDNVTSLALTDFDADGENELLVGSEDFDIRVFKKDELLTEMAETEAVTGLCSVAGPRFAYSLTNGTVGVYQGSSRWWRIKSKNQAMCICSYDIDGDGVPELITGWSNGKLDARNDKSGEVVFKDNFDSTVAGIVKGDYRLDGKTQLLCCSVDGEIRGYQSSATESRYALLDMNIEQETLRELSQRRGALLMELKNYQENQRISSASAATGVLPGTGFCTSEGVAVIPANTQLQTGLTINMGDEALAKPPHVEIALATTNDTIIRAVIIFAEGIFEGESHVYHPKENNLSSSIRVPIFPPKDVPVDLHIKALVGYKGSQHHHVFELTRQLPRFSMYSLSKAPATPLPDSYVKFQLQERVARLVMWLNQSFLLLEDLKLGDDGGVSLKFICLRKGEPLHIEVTPTSRVSLHCDSMDLVADIIQSLASYLNLEDLEVEANFPAEVAELSSKVEPLTEYQNTRQKLSAELADNSGVIRGLIVRGEDARLMGDLVSMKQWYKEVMSINQSMINGYKIRCNNHQNLLACLKTINQTIQRAASLRVGKSKTAIVNSCRQAIKNNNFDLLLKVIGLRPTA
ncbi:Ciliary BBSome complex subunit 2 C-terminal domain [Trinorchestia longiramus]|nr:Ciliary BBSome complex subunit 2 C-terminal domain [Trinorchestia longiramus]